VDARSEPTVVRLRKFGCKPEGDTILQMYCAALYEVPAKAGTHGSEARALEKWVPACAGTPESEAGKLLQTLNTAPQI